MRLVRLVINSNIYISLAAVALTVETQIQLGITPQWRPYLFLIFFATLCEYNIHRFITVITKKEALESEKHKWVKDHLFLFYAIVFISVAGFIVSALVAKKEVLFTLAPIALLTLFYSIPLYGNKKSIFRLREIPYLKIFIISFCWSTITILLPVIQAGHRFPPLHVVLMLVERFLFVFAITIPFDIRDIEADKEQGLKTIPLALGEERSIKLANFLLVVFSTLCFIHYGYTNQMFMLLSMVISSISTVLFLKSEKIKTYPLYHYAVLDGTLLLQGALVVGLSFLG